MPWSFRFERPGDFQRNLRQLLDDLLRRPGRRKNTDKYELIERVRQNRDVIRTIELALAFLHEFFERGRLPESALDRESRSALADFLKTFHVVHLPATNWESFLKVLKANQRRRWMQLPRLLFEKAHEAALKFPFYRAQEMTRQMPDWWKPDADPPRNCWLKDDKARSEWKQHCQSTCVLRFLRRWKFSLAEISSTLKCGNCRYGFSQCYPDIPVSRLKPGNHMSSDESSGTPQSPSGPDSVDPREKRDRDFAKRAQDYAERQVTDENLTGLLEELLTPPREAKEPTRPFSWHALLPGLRWGIVGGAAIILVAATLVLFKTQTTEPTLALVLQKDLLRSANPQTPAFIRAIPDRVNASFSPAKGEFSIELPQGERLAVLCVLTNTGTVGRRLWAGTAVVNGVVQGNQRTSGAGDVRIRTIRPLGLAELKQSDLDWVSLELKLTNSLTSGQLSLGFGTP